ncbi:hypothetical protein HK101_011959, partial [Irineochytrium annulatum]
ISAFCVGPIILGLFFVVNAPIPCFVFLWCRTFGLGIFFICVILKGARLIFLFRFSESRAAYRRRSRLGAFSLVASTVGAISGINAGDNRSGNPLSVSSGPSGSHVPGSNREELLAGGESPASVINLGSGRLHLPPRPASPAGGRNGNEQHEMLNLGPPSPPPAFDFDVDANAYRSWWFENKEKITDFKLALKILLPLAIALLAYCVALLFIPSVGVVDGIVYAPFGPNGAGGFGNLNGGLFDEKTATVMAIEVMFALVVCPIMIFLIRNLNDTYGIRGDLYLTMFASMPSIAVYFLLTLQKRQITAFNPYVLMNIAIFLSFITAIVRILPFPQQCDSLHGHIQIYPVHLSRKEERARRNMEMSLTMTTFLKILTDPALLLEFRNFCVRDFSVENVIFYEEVTNLHERAASSVDAAKLWRNAPDKHQDRLEERSTQAGGQSLASQDNGFVTAASSGDRGSQLNADGSRRSSSTTQNISASSGSSSSTRPLPPGLRDAYVGVYKLFIEAGRSPLEINVPGDMRNEVQRRIEVDDLTVDMFDRVLAYVVDNMFFNSFPKFRQHMIAKGMVF